jgi:hypothetical protein
MSARSLGEGVRSGAVVMGTLLAVLLPPAAALAVPQGPSLLYTAAVFVVATTAGHLGITVRHGYLDPLAWLQDAGIAVLMAGGAIVAERLTHGVGGGPVDPALLAVLGTYLLLAWPAWRKPT